MPTAGFGWLRPGPIPRRISRHERRDALARPGHGARRDRGKEIEMGDKGGKKDKDKAAKQQQQKKKGANDKKKVKK